MMKVQEEKWLVECKIGVLSYEYKRLHLQQRNLGSTCTEKLLTETIVYYTYSHQLLAV